MTDLEFESSVVNVLGNNSEIVLMEIMHILPRALVPNLGSIKP